MKVISAAALAVLAGCAIPPPTQQELAAAYYGPAPTNYKASVMVFMGAMLKDPESARYGFYRDPVKGYMGAARKFGWIACAVVNAKNSYGGYVGARRYIFLIRNNVVMDYENVDGRSYAYNQNISNWCSSPG